MLKKRSHKMKGKGDQKSRTSNILSIYGPMPDVSFSLINFSFWLCMITKRISYASRNPHEKRGGQDSAMDTAKQETQNVGNSF